MFQGADTPGQQIALDGYVDSVLDTETSDTITTEDTP
jgi:hypothetical protein